MVTVEKLNVQKTLLGHPNEIIISTFSSIDLRLDINFAIQF